jgi:DNA polymerase III subunit beta
MKFIINSQEFQKSISAVEGVITVREVRSVLSNIKVETSNDKVLLSATDLEISIRNSLSAQIEQEGNTLIPAKQLSNTFKTINFPKAFVVSDPEGDGTNSKTLITDAEKKETYEMTINGIENEDMRTIPLVNKSEIYEFSCVVLSEMIKKTNYAVAVDDTRFVFNGNFLIATEGKMIMVGTDGRRLSKIERTLPNSLPFSKGIIIPHKAIKEILKMIDTAETGKIGIIDNQIYIHIGNTELLCKLIDGNYPDYEAVIPKELKKKAIINKELFLLKLRQAMVSAEEPSRQIVLEFTKNNLQISASSQGSQEAHISMNIEYGDDDLSIAFKGDYLIDVARSVEDQEIHLHFSTANSPIIIKDPTDPQYTAVIMPMKI